MVLQLCPYEGTHLLHALAIDSHIAVPGTGGGAEVDGLHLVVEEELHVIDESKQQAGKFVMQVGLFFLDKIRAWQ